MTTSNQLKAKIPVRKGTSSRKNEAVLRLLEGEAIDRVSQELGVTITQLEKWKTTVL